MPRRQSAVLCIWKAIHVHLRNGFTSEFNKLCTRNKKNVRTQNMVANSSVCDCALNFFFIVHYKFKIQNPIVNRRV